MHEGKKLQQVENGVARQGPQMCPSCRGVCVISRNGPRPACSWNFAAERVRSSPSGDRADSAPCRAMMAQASEGDGEGDVI
jgi:hypothetical protein